MRTLRLCALIAVLSSLACGSSRPPDGSAPDAQSGPFDDAGADGDATLDAGSEAAPDATVDDGGPDADVPPDDAMPDDGESDAPNPLGGGRGPDGAVIIGPTGAPAPPATQGVALGDPHLMTFDGLRYDCQPEGELTLVSDPSDGLEIQIRSTPRAGNTDVAVSTAVAARVGTDVVVVHADGTVTVRDASGNRRSPRLSTGRNDLPGGGALYAGPNALAVVWPDNTQLRLSLFGDFEAAHVFLSDARRGRVVGLLGNADGLVDGDLRARDGTPVPASPTFGALYQGFVESWRVAQTASLFDYASGETTDTFTDRSLPRAPASTDAIPAAGLAAATATCRRAGAPDAWVDACVLDLTLAGDPTFAAEYADAPAVSAVLRLLPDVALIADAAPDASPDFAGPPRVDAAYPQTVVAGHPIEIVGVNLASPTSGAAAVTVTLTGTSDAGPVTITLTVLAASNSTLIVSTPADLFTQISGPATLTVTTPGGTAQLSVPEFVVESNGFDNDAGSDGFLGVVYKLLPDTPIFPTVGDPLDLAGPCASPSVVGPDAGADAGVACPFTSIEVPNLDVTPRHFTGGFPGLGSTLVEWFGIRFRGSLLVETPGTYAFETCSDDGSNVYIVTPEDGGTVHPLIANDGLHGSMCVDNSIALPEIGEYPLVVDYFQGPAPGIQLQLSWTPPGAPAQEIIPPEVLTAYVP